MEFPSVRTGQPPRALLLLQGAVAAQERGVVWPGPCHFSRLPGGWQEDWRVDRCATPASKGPHLAFQVQQGRWGKVGEVIPLF